MTFQPVDAALLGAGHRGYYTFGGYAKMYPHQLRFVALAEPDPRRRERFANDFNIPSENVFESWEDLLAKPQLAPVLVNATMDNDHFPSAMAALEAGYHILLEKPMATNAADCAALEAKVRETGRIVQLCHSLRYNPFFIALKKLLDDPETGELITAVHNEHIAFWHYAHSFVRGNWAVEAESSPGLLSKSCHDLDILCWLTGRLPAKAASFGSLQYFHPGKVDDSIPERCTDGCPIERQCPFSTIKMYLGDNTEWPVNTIATNLSYEGRLKALREGPYGRCVYRCGNDIVDHQVTLLEYDDGMTLSFQMHGHSHENARTMRFSASNATIRGCLERRDISVDYYNGGESRRIQTGGPDDMHGGGDTLMIDDFLNLVRSESPEAVVASARESLESHLLVFAAEAARKENRIVDVRDFLRRYDQFACER